MGRKHNEASKRFHDRVAPKYDQIYDDPFWEFHDRVTWNHLKNFLPKVTGGAGAPVLDLGCGTGKWGLKLLKAGYAVTFVDLSEKMLEQVREKLEAWKQQPDLAGKAARASVVAADAVDLKELPEGEFQLVVGMGDVVSICSDPGRAVGQISRVLAVGGMAVFTVDNALAALDHFAESGNLKELERFIRTGDTHWLTRQQAEQFEVHMFLPGEIEGLVRAKGLEMVSRVGKTILPVRANKRFFEKEGAMERLVELETRLGKEAAGVGRASHIQVAARKV